MILSRVFSFFLRVAELVSSVVVLGINGYYLDSWRKSHSHIPARFIYIEVAAALGTLFSLIWLIPTISHVALHAVADFILMVLFIAGFGLLVDWFGSGSCGGVFHWSGDQGNCQRWKATEAFLFLGAIFFLCSALLALWVSRRDRGTTTTTRRHRHAV